MSLDQRHSTKLDKTLKDFEKFVAVYEHIKTRPEFSWSSSCKSNSNSSDQVEMLDLAHNTNSNESIDCKQSLRPFISAKASANSAGSFQEAKSDNIHYQHTNNNNYNHSTSNQSATMTPQATGGCKKKDPTSHRIIEKRRRDRMNNCLSSLCKLIPTKYFKKGPGRVEKTEIVETAIKYMKDLMTEYCALLEIVAIKREYVTSENIQKTHNINDSQNNSTFGTSICANNVSITRKDNNSNNITTNNHNSAGWYKKAWLERSVSKSA